MKISCPKLFLFILKVQHTTKLITEFRCSTIENVSWKVTQLSHTILPLSGTSLSYPRTCGTICLNSSFFFSHMSV